MLAAPSQEVAGDAIVEDYDLAGEPTHGGREQEHRELSNVLGSPKAPEGNAAWRHLAFLLRVLAGVHQPRHHAVGDAFIMSFLARVALVEVREDDRRGSNP